MCPFESLGEQPRSLVHHNVLSAHMGTLEENLSITTICYDLAIGVWGNQNPLVVTQNDLFMHFFGTSRKCQIATGGFNDIIRSVIIKVIIMTLNIV